MPDVQKRYFHALDAIRFAAALLVAIFHLGYWSSIPGSTPGIVLRGATAYPELAPFAWSSWVGVEIFFVLSGFVIANSANGRSASEFFKGRFLRLYPAVWICAPLSSIVWLLVGDSSISDQAHRLLQTALLAPIQLMSWGWVDGVYWTLMYEVAFYVAAVIVLCARGRVTLIHLASFMSIASGAYIGLLILVHCGLVNVAVSEPFARYPYFMLTLLQLRHGVLFATGILLWCLSNGLMTHWRYLMLGVAIAGGLGEVYLRAWEFVSITPAFPGRHVHTPMLIWAIAVTCIALITRWHRLDEAITAAVASWLRLIGLATYPLYLLHDVVGAFVLRIAIGEGVSRWSALIFTLGTLFAMSCIVCRILEPAVRAPLSLMLSKILSHESRSIA